MEEISNLTRFQPINKLQQEVGPFGCLLTDMEKPLKPHVPLAVTFYQENFCHGYSRRLSNNWDCLSKDTGFNVAPQSQVTKENEIEKSHWLVHTHIHTQRDCIFLFEQMRFIFLINMRSHQHFFQPSEQLSTCQQQETCLLLNYLKNQLLFFCKIRLLSLNAFQECCAVQMRVLMGVLFTLKPYISIPKVSLG